MSAAAEGRHFGKDPSLLPIAIRLELVQGQNAPAQGSQALATNVG